VGLSTLCSLVTSQPSREKPWRAVMAVIARKQSWLQFRNLFTYASQFWIWIENRGDSHCRSISVTLVPCGPQRLFPRQTCKKNQFGVW
jgi:hypothetical protein